ncbi:MAG: MFS transporter [Elusimicrobiota bacterium]
MKRQLLWLALHRAFRSAAAGMISLAFPFLVLKTLRMSPLALGAIYASASVATAILGFVFGILADVWSRKKTLWLVTVLLPASSAVVCAWRSPLALFVAAILGGYSATGSLMGGGVGGAAQPILSAALTDLSAPNDRTKMFSLFMFLSGALAALGALMVRFLSVEGAFLAATIISASGILCLLPLHLPSPAPDQARLKSTRTIGQFSLTGALNGFSQGLLTPFMIPFFILVYHVTARQMAVYGFASGFLGALAILAAPTLERRLGFVRSIAWTRGTGALLLAAMPLFRFLPLALLIYLVTPALRTAALPIQQDAMAGLVSAGEIGRVFGTNQVSRLAASAAAIFLTGLMFSAAEIALPFYLYGAVMAANIGLYFRFFGGREAAA